MTERDDEATLSESFWPVMGTEVYLVQEILQRRFPQTYADLSTSLEAADPMDVVYPGNPDEYSDVVRELIVLLAPVNGDISKIGDSELEHLVIEALRRCFGEEADGSRVVNVVRLLRQFRH